MPIAFVHFSNRSTTQLLQELHIVVWYNPLIHYTVPMLKGRREGEKEKRREGEKEGRQY